MSNKLLGFLIILIFILAGIAFYMYAFVTYTGKLIITTNVGEYSVELHNKKTFKTIFQECGGEKCELSDIAPFDYNLVISKEGYIKHQEKISIGRKEVKSLVIALQKDTKLVGVAKNGELKQALVEDDRNQLMQTHSGTQNSIVKTNLKEDIPLTQKEILLSKKEKIERLQRKKQYYFYSEITNFGEIYFKIEGTKMNMYYKNELGKEKLISHFDYKVEKTQIFVKKVFGDDQKVYISYGDEKFLYNDVMASLDKISFNIPILYIKSGIDKSLMFITEKGVFLYKDKEFEYLYIFSDFVYTNGNYIGVLSEDDSKRKTNLNLEHMSGNLLVLYNPQTKEKKVIYKPLFAVEKILVKQGNIMIENSNGEQFNLENY